MNYTDTCVIPNKNLFSFCLRSPNIDINVAASLKQLVSIHAGSELLILTSASTVIKKFRKRSVNKKNMAAKTLSQEWSSILIAYFREQLKNKAKFNIDLNKEAVFQPIQSKTPSLETFTVVTYIQLNYSKVAYLKRNPFFELLLIMLPGRVQIFDDYLASLVICIHSSTCTLLGNLQPIMPTTLSCNKCLDKLVGSKVKFMLADCNHVSCVTCLAKCKNSLPSPLADGKYICVVCGQTHQMYIIGKNMPDGKKSLFSAAKPFTEKWRKTLGDQLTFVAKQRQVIPKVMVAKQKQMELGLKKLNDACQTYNLKNQLVLEEKAHLKQQMMARSREPSSTRAFSVGNKSVNSLSSCVGTKTPSVHGPRKSEIESTNPLRRTLFPVIIKKPNRSSNMLSDGGPLHTSTPLDAAEDTIRLNTFKMPKEIRVKVKKRWARNIFYPKLLRDWMEAAGTSEAKRTFKNALEGTSKYPFHIIDQSELKQVPGVGPTLSVKLDDAYRELCNFMSPEPDIHLIDKLGRGEALALLTSAKKANKVSRKKSLGKPNDKRKSGLSQEIVNMRVEECDTSQVREGPNESMSQELPELERSIYVADPSTEKGEVVLVCDNREQTGMRGKKSVVDYLIKNNVPHQLRPLSVGDFIWLWKTETREIVLDYVIERKAWDDLKSSIRSNRLDDQKTRLKDSGVANLVLLAEGRETPDESLEQCLATFSVTHKFFIQRTENASDTALFLRTLTERFEARAKNESFSGPNYTHYQDKNKKTKPLTVREIFAKQLTVCPQMSIDKALLIAQRFPNFKSLFKLYQLNNTKGESQRTCPKVLLNKHISQIPVSLSTQVSVFFNKT